MARDRDDDSFSRRRREREEEEAREKLSAPSKRDIAKGVVQDINASDSTEAFMELVRQADMLVDQVNSLYQMFGAGVERLPPIEKEKVLDKAIFNLQNAPKPTPSAKFRFSGVQSRYLAYKDKWVRLMKDLESGVIKRTAGPKR